MGNLSSRLRSHIKQLLGRALRLVLWSLAAMLSQVLDQSFSGFDLNALLVAANLVHHTFKSLPSRFDSTPTLSTD